MRIQMFPFETEIIFDDENINILEVENKALFSKIIETINNLINGETGEEHILLIENGKILELAKHAIMVFDILNIAFNDKKILNKLIKKIDDDLASDDEIRNEIYKQNVGIMNILDNILSEYSFELNYKGDITIQDYLKTFGVKVNNSNYQTFLEKILGFIDIITELELFNILILCNVKAYFKEEELIEIYKFSKYKQINLLLIESTISEICLPYENKMIIDKDFDDFFMKV